MKEYVILPLFSEQGGINVPNKSGLNQWNAYGRPRDYNEVYIPIPSWIHSVFGGFFPGRDTSFTLILPDGTKLSAKVCQSNDKALMSNPNSDLGQWILRTVLNLESGDLATYETLEDLDIDSVVVSKESEGCYSIDYCKLGTYANFKRLNKKRY